MKGVIFMSGRKIYSAELKLEIMERYLKGDIGLKKLAQEYHVNYGNIQKWRDAYQEHGVEGLSTTHGTYTGKFKVSVVEYMNNTGASIRKTAAHFNIPSFSTVSQWERIYYEQGKDALFKEQRGRTSKMGRKRLQKSKTNIETNEDMLAEVQRLSMENEYLKKLNALIQKRERSEKRTK